MVSAPQAQSRVLLVEDSPTQALQLRALLESDGLSVTHVLSGEAALAQLNEELPHLIIADYHLPGMNGDELARQVRANIRTRALPILMLTQDLGQSSERHGLESGADDYIPKSSDREMLLWRIHAMLRQQTGRAGGLHSFTQFRAGRVVLVTIGSEIDHRLQDILVDERLAVKSVRSLADARKEVEAGVDCVLVDIRDKWGSGFSACRAIDGLRTELSAHDVDTAHFQLVAVVGDAADRDQLAQGYRAGADDILSLKADDELLRLRIRTLVRRAIARDENLRIERELREQQVALAQAAAQAAATEAARMAELLEGERRFRTIFDTGYQLIWLLTLEGEIIVVNRTALETTGEAAEVVVGRPLWQTAWWKDASVDAAHLEQQVALAREGQFVRFEAELKDGKGGRRIFDFAVRPALDSEGHVVQIVAEAHDVTEFKETEAALRQSQKMEAIGQITGGVAHDFNNLLMAVTANLELLRKRLPDDPTLQRYIDGALQGASRGVSLTQRLLAFARKQDLQSEPTDVASLLTNMKDLLERSVGPTIAIEYRLDTDVPRAQADPNQLELAVLNLVVNARDAMPAGGSIVVEAGMRTVERPLSDLDAGRYVRIAVIDNGAGMDEETRLRAIEPFFSTKETGKGTGLGLSMVHGMAMQLSGALRLESTPGEGTRVEIWLPTAKDAPEQTADLAPAAHATPSPAATGTILLVDDDPLIAMSMVDMLEDLGHSVIEAGSPQQALSILESDAHLDLLITDYAMPQMTGGELAVRAKELRPDLPILLATGYADMPPDAKIELPRITKPYNQAFLAEQLALLLRTRD
jgi:PAS domain S-box-containing protein